MKDKDLSGLARRIRQELDKLEHVSIRIGEGWQRARRSNDDYYLDSVALNLHGFYSGLERIFTLIAETIDGSLPRGEKLAYALTATNDGREATSTTCGYFKGYWQTLERVSRLSSRCPQRVYVSL